MTTEQALANIYLILADPCASAWLTTALRAAIRRDKVDAANDAEILCRALAELADAQGSA